MDQDRNLARVVEAEHRRRRGVEDLVHPLDLEEVVARAQGSELVIATGEGPLAHFLWLRPRNPTPRLDAPEVARSPVPIAHGPLRPAHQHLAEFEGAESQPAVGADP